MMFRRKFPALVTSSLLWSLIVSTKFQVAEGGQGQNRCHLTVEEAHLPANPQNVAPDGVAIDIYRCAEETGGEGRPLLILACGGSIFKESYELFASKLTRKGFVVAVVDHPWSVTSNFANALDVSDSIAYVETQTFQVDTSRIVLIGHSFGGGVVLGAINEECPFPFCRTPPGTTLTVPLHPGVVLATTFGFALTARGGGPGQEAYWETRTNENIPFCIINGDGDINYFTEFEGENLTEGTFARLNPTKVIATIENLDHFSISQQDPDLNRGDVLSTLPRETQIDIVADAVGLWIKVSLGIPKQRAKGPDLEFCRRIKKLGHREGYAIVDCLEEYDGE